MAPCCPGPEGGQRSRAREGWPAAEARPERALASGPVTLRLIVVGRCAGVRLAFVRLTVGSVRRTPREGSKKEHTPGRGHL